MGITYFLDKPLTVRRVRRSTGFKQGYSATASVTVHMQAISDEKALAMGSVMGRSYAGWKELDEPIRVQQGDHLIDRSGRVFEVKTVNNRDFGINQHQELILERVDNSETV